MNMCIQTAIRSFKAKYKISKSYPKGHPFFFFFFFFFRKIQNFENCTQTTIRFFTTKYKILKTTPKRPLIFLQQNTEF